MRIVSNEEVGFVAGNGTVCQAAVILAGKSIGSTVGNAVGPTVGGFLGGLVGGAVTLGAATVGGTIVGAAAGKIYGGTVGGTVGGLAAVVVGNAACPTEGSASLSNSSGDGRNNLKQQMECSADDNYE